MKFVLAEVNAIAANVPVLATRFELFKNFEFVFVYKKIIILGYWKIL